MGGCAENLVIASKTPGFMYDKCSIMATRASGGENCVKLCVKQAISLLVA